MSNHSILQKEVISNNLPRNSFDLSYRHLFTADVGELLPVYVEHVNPNEKFSINPQVFLRAQTLNTAAFTRIKQNIDFFFIPYRLLSSFLPQVLVGTDFTNSNVFPDSVNHSQVIPLVRCGAVKSNTTSSWPINAFDVDDNLNPAKSHNDIMGYKRMYKAARLVELLGYGRSSQLRNSNENATERFFGLSSLNLFAYNHVYFDFYRNPLLEKYNSHLCNFDSFYTSINTSDYFDNLYLKTDIFTNLGFFDIRYHNYKNDYFTHQTTDFRIADFVNTDISVPKFPNTDVAPFASHTQAGLDFDNSEPNNYLTVSSLRSAYALDKLLAVSQNAKDGSYNEQIAAHFGFNPSLDNQKVQFIGSCSSPVTISDVEATATTANSTVGQIVGKGVSLANGSFEFSTREHGIIMGIFYLLPEADYDARMTLNPFNLKTDPSKFFKPEFSDLGYQPCTELELLGPSAAYYTTPMQNNIFGYTNRYSEYKSRVDIISGEFNTDLNAWVTPRSYENVTNANGVPLSLYFTKVSPASVDNIFAVAADGLHNQFLCAAQFNVTAIRPMSIFGSPYSNI